MTNLTGSIKGHNSSTPSYAILVFKTDIRYFKWIYPITEPCILLKTRLAFAIYAVQLPDIHIKNFVYHLKKIALHILFLMNHALYSTRPSIQLLFFYLYLNSESCFRRSGYPWRSWPRWSSGATGAETTTRPTNPAFYWNILNCPNPSRNI